MQNWIFTIITPVFSVTWFFRNHIELQLKKHFWLLSMLKTVVLFNVLVEIVVFFYFRILSWILSWKEQHLFKIEIFSNILIVLTVTFNKFNATLQNKSIKNLTGPKPLNNFFHILYSCNIFLFSYISHRVENYRKYRSIMTILTLHLPYPTV